MKSTKKNSVRVWTMIMGIITAMLIVCSQLFSLQTDNYSKKQVKASTATAKEHKQEKSSDDHYISLPSVSQPSSSIHVEANQKLSCLFEILFEKDEQENHPINVPLSVGKLFHTLFRVIISPNAP